MNISTLDRRKFLRGSGIALALPWLESFSSVAQAAKQTANRKRLACFYLPDGVPMPLEEDPSFKDWSWFPHGKGKDFTFTKCMETLHPLRDDLTVFSGLSHPACLLALSLLVLHPNILCVFVHRQLPLVSFDRSIE